MSIQKKISINPEEKKSLDIILKEGYKPSDIKQFIQAFNRQASNKTKPYKIGKNKIKVGVFGDTHIGNINYDPQLMKWYIKETKKRKVDFHINLGDIFDGWYQNRPSSIFEQNAIGFDRQIKMAVEEFSGLESPLYFITGNHSYNTFVRGAGVEAGPIFRDRLTKKGVESHYLGNGEGDIILKGGTNVKLLHPDGGSAYALSYHTQKIIESLSGGEKPEVLLVGHYHKIEYLFYRNIHCFQTGTMCGQTKFMRGKHIPAHKAFWIIDIRTNDDGEVSSINPKLYPSYQ